jgi:CUB domain
LKLINSAQLFLAQKVEFCGNTTPHEFYSTGNTVRITFISDSSVARSGRSFLEITEWIFFFIVASRTFHLKTSVSEPELEPVEQQLFAGAGAKVFFGPARAPEPGM